jgi:hypothetical protein
MDLDGLRSRLVYTALDAVMTASLRPRGGFKAHVKAVLSPRSSNYNRVGSLVRLADSLLPGTAKWASKALCRSRRLPFPDATVELLGYGSAATVFLLKDDLEPEDDPGDGRVVLKVFRKSLGKNLSRLLEIADLYRKKYEAVATWYDGALNIVPDAVFLVFHGPLLGLPAVACLQTYIAGETMDLLHTFTDDEIVRLMRQDLELRRQFVFFAERTLAGHERDGLCFDLLGRGNLLLSKRAGAHRLHVIDCGFFDTRALRTEEPERFDRVEGCLRRLESLLGSVSRSAPSTSRLADRETGCRPLD